MADWTPIWNMICNVMSCHVCIVMFIVVIMFTMFIMCLWLLVYGIVLLICYSNKNIFLHVCLLAITPPTSISPAGLRCLGGPWLGMMWGVSLGNAHWILWVYKLTKWSNPKFSIQSLLFFLFFIFFRTLNWKYYFWICAVDHGSYWTFNCLIWFVTIPRRSQAVGLNCLGTRTWWQVDTWGGGGSKPSTSGDQNSWKIDVHPPKDGKW